MSEAQISLSETAARQIREIVKGQDKPYLRVSVVGGGCSGFSYQFDLEAERAEDDLAIERDGATVLIDEMSVDFLKGSEIDYVDELIGASFRIHNPNATAACGCGTSFSI
ncbi:MAG TPA: iron-sulfur cluster insertion protein ErpA [Oceanicaulis sp.]|jgi:iron-sulfur cluster assembly accessory protein|nr:iron-sulfur cluster insertion protein ErpA [Glycocaulis albus]MBV5258012.1 iron-sulfur cluster insertion protein ErpA [Synechococcus moorigangaii CMS01]HCY56924.1 iron-sulfur cluster insertion protein ErpA [Oceanicaulis sp.]